MSGAESHDNGVKGADITPNSIVAILLGIALATILVQRWLPWALVCAVVVASVSLGAGYGWIHAVADRLGRLPALMQAAAGLALFWAIIQAVVLLIRVPASDDRRNDLRVVLHLGVLTPAFLGAILAAIVAVVQLSFVGVQLWAGGPLRDRHWEILDRSGLLNLGAVWLACFVLLMCSKRRALATAQFWLTVLIALWLSLLTPPFTPVRMESSGLTLPGRSAWSLGLMVSLATILIAFVAAQGVLWNHWRWSAWPAQPRRLRSAPPAWPGFRLSAGIVGLGILFLGCYHLAYPVQVITLGPRWVALISFFCCIAAGGASLELARRHWNENLADAGLALFSLALCCAAVIAVPSGAQELADRFPMIFNAILVALAAASWFWHWLASVWQQQLGREGPWTTAGRLIVPAHRFGFIVGAMGIWVGMMMAIWPELPGIAVMDNSIGRWAFGVGGNLLLLLSLAWSSRSLGRPALSALTWLALISLGSFLVVRVLPYTTRYT